jgi:hypothetical protein
MNPQDNLMYVAKVGAYRSAWFGDRNEDVFVVGVFSEEGLANSKADQFMNDLKAVSGTYASFEVYVESYQLDIPRKVSDLEGSIDWLLPYDGEEEE